MNTQELIEESWAKRHGFNRVEETRHHQALTADLILASQLYRAADTPEVKGPRDLRDFNTVCVFLPQRSGNSMMAAIYLDPDTDCILTNDSAREWFVGQNVVLSVADLSIVREGYRFTHGSIVWVDADSMMRENWLGLSNIFRRVYDLAIRPGNEFPTIVCYGSAYALLSAGNGSANQGKVYAKFTGNAALKDSEDFAVELGLVFGKLYETHSADIGDSHTNIMLKDFLEVEHPKTKKTVKPKFNSALFEFFDADGEHYDIFE